MMRADDFNELFAIGETVLYIDEDAGKQHLLRTRFEAWNLDPYVTLVNLETIREGVDIKQIRKVEE